MEYMRQNLEFQGSQSGEERRLPWGVRWMVVLGLAVGFLMYRIVYRMDFAHVCLYDALQTASFPINRSMASDKYSIVLLIGQLFIDVSISVYGVYWVLNVRNMRAMMAVAFFDGMRTLTLLIWKLPFPPYMVWHQPPIPSLFVAYDRTSDFYFSGHTGHTMLLLLEVFALGMPLWVKIFMNVQLIFMVFMLITSRVHYTIDVVGGFIFGYFSFFLSQQYVFYYDYIWSLPFLGFRKVKEECYPDEENNVLIQEK